MLLACLLAISSPTLAHEPKVDAPGTAVASNSAAWLGSYDAVRTALVADDLAGSAVAARALAVQLSNDLELAAAATGVSEAVDLAAQRAAFAALSRLAVQRISAAGSPKVVVYHCPMVQGYAYWLQPKAGIANPYMGRSMPTCGEEVSLKAAAKAASAG